MKPITASILYNYVRCPHRVWMDVFADPAGRDGPNSFVRLLWEHGSAFEREVMDALGLAYLDLSRCFPDEKERRADQAMRDGVGLIYGGRIAADDLLGAPDLLRREGSGYVAVDIRSGDGGGDAGPRRTYAVQLALYADILERKGLAAGRHAFVRDGRGREVRYDLDAPYGGHDAYTFWDDYRNVLTRVRAIMSGNARTRAAHVADCKLCDWHDACLAQLEAADDLTLIPGLGPAKREVLEGYCPTIEALAGLDPVTLIVGKKKTIMSGISPATLRTFHARARLLKAAEPRPYLRHAIELPRTSDELFFDVEVDPLRDLCYLHGFVERHEGDDATERYVHFLMAAPTREEEERAFAEALAYMRRSQSSVIYYYSTYERTIYRKLQQKYPTVCASDDIDALFASTRAVDLCGDVVRKSTEWPTRDHSIKTLARYLGFVWRDTHPSGAASIEWYDRWVRTGDPTSRRRILDYNEDDCRATRVLLDGIRRLETLDERQLALVQ